MTSIVRNGTVDSTGAAKVPTAPTNIPAKPDTSNGGNNNNSGTCTPPAAVKCFTEVTGQANMPPFISLYTNDNQCWAIDTSTLSDSTLSATPTQCGADEPFCVSFTGKTSTGS